MPFVDRIIQFLQSQQGERIVLENDQLCMIYRSGGLAAPTKDRLNYHQISNLITEIIPDENRPQFATGEPFIFQYAYGSGQMDVEVSCTNGNIRVSIGVPESREAPIILPEFHLEEVDPPASDGHAEAASHEPARHAYTQPAHAGGGRRIEHLDELFRLLKQMEGSDLHLCSREKPYFRVYGQMKKLDQYEINDPDHLKEILFKIAPQRNRDEWDRDHDTDFAYEIVGVARFRCNLFADRHGPGAVFRLIPTEVLTAQQLNLPQAVLELCFLSKGLVVVTGPTGSGKSTTLAAIVDHVNKHRDDHIITIEDPVEFVHHNINCLVNQREVHVHTNSFSRALRAALREDPDIVLVGEMRDLETVQIAIETAETGHLVFGTLHTTTAASTVDRIIDQFPADQQEQIRTMLAESLKAVIAQTLCRTKEGKRVAALEILLVDPACANLIREGKTYQLASMMQIGKARGCVTMNDSLFAHVKAGRVEAKEAYIKAVDKTGLLGSFEKEGIPIDIASGT
jgi:twitching motility protein PilT